MTNEQVFYKLTAHKIVTVRDLYKYYVRNGWDFGLDVWRIKEKKIMIINGNPVTPDIWEQIKDLEITDGLNHLYKIGYFGDLAPWWGCRGFRASLGRWRGVFRGVSHTFVIWRRWGPG